MGKILIENIMIITMENEESIIKDGYILIEGKSISKVGEGSYTGDRNNIKIINGKGCAAVPGFINCHTHIAMTLLRGYGEGLPLMRWLNEKIWPFEAKLNKDDIYFGTMLGIAEMIKSGTTTFVDMYFKESETGRASVKAGIRAYLGNPLLGDSWRSQLDETYANYEMFRDNDTVKPMIAPHSVYTCSMEALKCSGDFARKHKIPLHIHIAETEDEIKMIKDKYDKTPVEVCDDAGIFNDNTTIAAHCVHVNAADIKIMKNYRITAVHNPESNMKLASGICPVKEMMDEGINVSLGTDGASSNNNLNMIDEMKAASFLQKLSKKDAMLLSGYEALKLATVNGAKAINMEDSLGKIKPGYLADIAIFNVSKPNLVPLYDIYSNIVFASSGNEVKTVIINGSIVMEDNELVNIDENYLVANAQKVVESIIKR